MPFWIRKNISMALSGHFDSPRGLGMINSKGLVGIGALEDPALHQNTLPRGSLVTRDQQYNSQHQHNMGRDTILKSSQERGKAILGKKNLRHTLTVSPQWTWVNL
jgi:hypothetical protein